MSEFFDELRRLIIQEANNEFKEISFKYTLQTGEVEEYKFVLGGLSE